MKLRPAPDATVPTRPSSLLLPLILLLLLVLPQAAAAQRADAFQSRASEPAIRASERAEVEAALQQQGRARIIVEIVPEQNREPESALNEAQIQAQRARIGRNLRRFSASVEARAAQRTDPQGRPAVEIHHHFETVPYVVMTVDSAAFAHLLERDEVRNIQPDRLDEPQMDDTVGLTGASQAWTAGYTGDGQSVVIMDTGTQLDHPNLSANMETDACFSSNVSELSASSLCLNGDTERTGGNTFDCGIEDGFSPCRHGTHVAGTVAGTGSGFSGMAPDAGLIPIQVFTKFDDADICGGTAPCVLAYTSDQMKGYEYVYTTLMQTYDIAAINVSLGGGQYENTCDYDARKPLIDQLREANIATIIASGNNGSTSSGIAPGCISSAVTVGSTTKS
ncbi:MAG: S8 family peptidase, partial [Cyclonatronaceae bacterium]